MTQPDPSLALTFILITVALDAIGIGLIFPVMPDLIRAVTGDSLSQAALWGGVLAAAFAVMQFLFGRAVGSLSDSFGRRHDGRLRRIDVANTQASGPARLLACP